MDYTQWVADALERNPALSQAGLARHLGRHRTAITHMLQGTRLIKADELEQIAQYLGVPVPSRASASMAGLPFGGRIDHAWREDRNKEPEPDRKIAPVLDEAWPVKTQAWYAVGTGTPCNSIRAGDVLIVHETHEDMARSGKFLIVRRERAGMSNLSIATRVGAKLAIAGETVAAKDKPEVIGTLIEIRRRA